MFLKTKKIYERKDENNKKEETTDDLIIPLIHDNSTLSFNQQDEPFRIDIKMIGKEKNPSEDSISVEYKINKNESLLSIIFSILH